MFWSCTAFLPPPDKQGLLVRGMSEWGANQMKIKKGKGNRMRSDVLKIIFTVTISSVTIILKSHTHEQLYSKTSWTRGSRVSFQSQAWFLLVSRGFSYFPSTFKAAVPHSFPKGVAVLRSGCRLGCNLPQRASSRLSLKAITEALFILGVLQLTLKGKTEGKKKNNKLGERTKV